jgi:uncharacterized protein YyaL (SSP411 family)
MLDIAWLSWSAESFARAGAERKPVLLSIVAGWSQACREMDETSYADPAVAAIVDECFVAIRVDADRRPDISERYSLGGWPTTAFLTADGALVGGGTFVPQDRMAAVLRQAAAAFETRAGEIAAEGARESARLLSPPAPHGADPPEPALVDATFASFDEEYGGFGTAPKFPLAAPVRLALHLHRDEADARAAHIATVSLDAMGWGPLHDEADGGFFRCADARTWEQPHREKLLEVNAALIDLYVDAAEILGSQRYADRAHDALRYVQNWLADQVDGGWAGSERADTAYDEDQGASFDTRRAHRDQDAHHARPRVDRTLFASWNGAMASAALHAAHAFQDDTLGAFAITSLERVLTICYKPGQGIAHYVEGGTRVAGLLEDHFAVAGACLDAHDATGNIVYEMMAEELARHTMRTMWDEQAGGFVDRTVPDARDAIGLMRRRLTPFVANCDAAIVLRRLAASSGESEFATVADSALAAVSGSAMAQGPHAAHYLLARRAARLR